MGSSWEHEKTKSTEADDAHATRRACPHGWARLAQPMGSKGGLLWFRSRCWKQQVRAAGWHESENHHKPRPPREREKKVAVIRFSAFVLIFLHPACTHILQLMLKSNETPLVQTLDLRYYPDCFPFFPPYCMPNPWISWINKSFTRGLLPPHCTWCFPVPSEVKWRNSRK